MHVRTWAFVLACGLWLAPAGAAQATALYLTDQSTEVAGYSDVKLLDPMAPTGDGTATLIQPVAEDPGALRWASAPITDDLVFDGDTTVDLYFDAGVDAASTTTVTLSYVSAESTEELGSDSDAQPGQAAPHQETFTIDTSGDIVPEGAVLLLTVEVTGAGVAVQLAYGGDGSPSGIKDMPWTILDSDGDGFGDSEERRAGSDPNDAASDPDNPTSDTTGGAAGETDPADATTDPAPAQESGGDTEPAGDATSPEILLASMFFLLCLIFAGIALIGRTTT